MIEYGKVIYSKEKLVIELTGYDKAKCEGCTLCKKDMEKRTLELPPEEGIVEGQTVGVEIQSGRYFLLLTLIYLFPLIFIAAGYGLAGFFTDNMVLRILSGLVFCGAAIYGNIRMHKIHKRLFLQARIIPPE